MRAGCRVIRAVELIGGEGISCTNPTRGWGAETVVVKVRGCRTGRGTWKRAKEGEKVRPHLCGRLQPVGHARGCRAVSSRGRKAGWCTTTFHGTHRCC